jgi:glycosyltransferase involved in cell wall biosynthesis
MPTANRRTFLPGAIRCFLAQDYRASELLILDDGADAVRDLIPADPRIRYERCGRMDLGRKRNMACAMASGEIITHWDDDDWSSPGRLSDQATRLLSEHADIGGYREMMFADPVARQAWVYHGEPAYCVGTSLIYTASYWRAHPFLPLQVGEDNAFLAHARRASVADGLGMMVARIHPASTTRKRGADLGPPTWTPMSYSDLPEGFSCA